MLFLLIGMFNGPYEVGAGEDGAACQALLHVGNQTALPHCIHGNVPCGSEGGDGCDYYRNSMTLYTAGGISLPLGQPRCL